MMKVIHHKKLKAEKKTQKGTSFSLCAFFLLFEFFVVNNFHHANLPIPSNPNHYFTQSQPRVLIFSKTTGFRHDSIPDGITAIRQLGQQNGFDVDATEDSTLFNDANLSRYQSIVFMSTTGDVLEPNQQAAFERYIRNGGGFVGIHSASDTEYDWPWYGGIVGAYFLNHPEIQLATIRVEESSHPSTSPLPTAWMRVDEWYNFRFNPRGRVKVLATLDENTYNGGGMGSDHPIAWCQLYDGGRSWYTAGGHTKESFTEPLYRQHLLGGIQFAAKIRDGPCASLAATSAASFTPDPIASQSIGSIFGSALATTTESASVLPLPTSLANTSVRFKDGAGNEHLAPLFFVASAQINFQVPPNAASGATTFTVVKSDGTAPSGIAQIAAIAPGLFAANANGEGVAAGVALRSRQDGSQRFESIAQFDLTEKKFVEAPINLGPATDQVFLVLYGTGIRNNGSLSLVTATIGGTQAQVTFAGAQGELVGLDQSNILIPRTLAGRGQVDVVLTIDGKTSNTLRVNIL
jgi:uncharacterized protein (TIGR03437 family)